MTRVLVLMSRLSDYMMNCMVCWQETEGVELHLVRRKIDSDAPFRFADSPDGLKLYQREDFDSKKLQSLMREIDPTLIICFGWMDKDYLSLVRARSSGCKAVMTMDNQWLGTARQRLGLFWSRFRLLPIFDYVWVPGTRQRSFALRLGFSEDQIREGLYVANATNFNPIWEGVKTEGPVKRLVFTGRYVKEKGLETLWDAFISYHERRESTLELWCIGVGVLYSEKPDHPKIRHLGFVQPSDLSEKLAGGGIFILPSTFEPWGLVVQEFALAGFPLVLSRNVGAADFFLGDDNGLLLPSVSREALIDVFATIDSLSDRELATMSSASRARAEQLSAAKWTQQAGAFMEGDG